MKEIPNRGELLYLYRSQQHSLREIGEIYGVSPTTAHRWLRSYGISTRPPSPRFRFHTINGVQHKLCKGPLHRKGSWVCVDDYFKRPDGFPRPHCKACESFHRGSERMIPAKKYLPWIEHIIDRLGIIETARRLEISQQSLWRITNGKSTKLKRRTVRKIVALHIELRKTREVRHRDSIRHGAAQRGRPEKPIKYKKDLYRKGYGDDDTLRKRKSVKRLAG